jgi:hypothetical protein
MYCGTPNLTAIITGVRMFGKMCRRMMRHRGSPNACAATANSCPCGLADAWTAWVQMTSLTAAVVLICSCDQRDLHMSMTTEARNPIEVFFWYSHQDQRYNDELVKHLSYLNARV